MGCFEGVRSQKQAVAELERELSRNRLSHAYLFEGQVGTGRRTLARSLAAAALGLDEPALLANHPDFLELPSDVPNLRIHRFAERESGSGSSKEEVDHPPVLHFVRLRPMQAARRVVLIPDAERMGDQAANAFLKTLEEPPGGALLLLTTTARDRLLATIVSRCRRIRVQPWPQAVIEQELIARDLANAIDAKELAVLAEGSFGVALDLAEGETLTDWTWLGGVFTRISPDSAVELGKGWAERARRDGKSAQEQRRAATGQLDLAALWLRRQLRLGLDPLAVESGLQILWRAGEQLAQNVRLELALLSAAMDLFAVLRRARNLVVS